MVKEKGIPRRGRGSSSKRSEGETLGKWRQSRANIAQKRND